MPVNVTDVDEFTSPVNYPDDGEDADSGSILECIQDLANRTSWLKKRLIGYGTDTSQWFPVPLAPVPGGQFNFVTSPSYALRQTAMSDVSIFPLPTMLGGTIIKQIAVRSRGRGGHSSTPQIMPNITLYRQSPYDSPAYYMATDVAAASAGLYEAGITTTITLGGSGLTTVVGNAYYLRVRGENGIAAIADGWEVFSIWVRLQGTD